MIKDTAHCSPNRHRPLLSCHIHQPPRRRRTPPTWRHRLVWSWAFHGSSNSPGAYRRTQASVGVAAILHGIASSSSRGSMPGNRCLSAVYLSMGRSLGAVLSDRQQGEDDDCWGRSPVLSLVTYIKTWPDATLDEMAVFIYNEGGGSLLPSGNFETSRDARHNKKEGFYRRLPDATAGRSVSSVGILELPPPPWHFAGATKESH